MTTETIQEKEQVNWEAKCRKLGRTMIVQNGMLDSVEWLIWSMYSTCVDFMESVNVAEPDKSIIENRLAECQETLVDLRSLRYSIEKGEEV